MSFGLFAIRQRRSLYAFGNADLRFNIDYQILLIYTDILGVDLCSAKYTINILLNSVSSQCARGKSSPA